MTLKLPPEDSRSDEILQNARRQYADISEALTQALKQLTQCDDKKMRAFSSTNQTY